MRKAGFTLGKIKVTRYLAHLNTKLEADCIAVEHEIPTSKTRGGKKNLLTDDNMNYEQLGNTYDNWMDRGNNGSTVVAQKKVPKKGKQKKMFFTK